MPVRTLHACALVLALMLVVVSSSRAVALEQISSQGIEELVQSSDCELNLVFFWATWCGPCKLEFPHYIEARQQYSEDQLCISGISLDYDPSMAKEYIERMKTNFPIYVAEESVMDEYELGAIPRLFLYDSQGHLLVDHTGYTSMESLQEMLKEGLSRTR